MGGMRFPPSGPPPSYHYIDLAGVETVDVPQPALSGDADHGHRPSGEKHFARTARDLPEVFRDVMKAWDASWRKARTSHMHQAMRDRDMPRSTRSGRGWSEARHTSFYGFMAVGCVQVRSFRHPRYSVRSDSAPAAGTPIFPTRSWKSCASSTPMPTTTTAPSSAASSSAEQLWRLSPGRWRTGRTAPLWSRSTAAPAAGVTRLHVTPTT